MLPLSDLPRLVFFFSKAENFGWFISPFLSSLSSSSLSADGIIQSTAGGRRCRRCESRALCLAARWQHSLNRGGLAAKLSYTRAVGLLCHGSRWASQATTYLATCLACSNPAFFVNGTKWDNFCFLSCLKQSKPAFFDGWISVTGGLSFPLFYFNWQVRKFRKQKWSGF